MKKIYLISFVTIMLGLIFYAVPHWFRFLWGGQFLLLPMLAGMLMVLVQDEDKSYRFLPKLIIGSLMTNFILLILLQVIEYDHDGYFVFWGFLAPALFLAGISIFGGLIGIVIRGFTLLLNIKFESKFILVFKKVFGFFLIVSGGLGFLTSIIIFLILLFYPSSSLLNWVMVDFKLIEIIGVFGYYLLLLSAFFILTIPLIFILVLGMFLFKRKIFLNFRMSLTLLLVLLLWSAIFTLFTFEIETRFEAKKAETKANQSSVHFYVKDFNKIIISKYVKFDEIIIRQGEKFDIVAKGSEYDQLGLDFEKINNDTLYIKRSEFETYYNTDTWTMENRNVLFPAGTKHLVIEIVIPDIEKIEIEGGNVELIDLDIDNIEIKLNKRFNNIKGNIKVEDTLKLDAKGGIINLSGSAKNLVINSGDCWIEMNNFMTKNAIINAISTSRLNVNASNNVDIQTSENSDITNHYNE